MFNINNRETGSAMHSRIYLKVYLQIYLKYVQEKWHNIGVHDNQGE